MEVNTSLALIVKDQSQIAEARRLALQWASVAGFDEVKAGRFTIVVSEAATNLFKHAGGGELVFKYNRRDSVAGLELFAIDSGKGIENIQSSMRDGYSTAGTAGNGLGAMQRQADEFDIFSVAGKGTVIWARIWAQNTDISKTAGFTIEGISVPVLGEDVCGDGWIAKQESQGTLVLVADGLGHGPLAAIAAREAKRIFMQLSDRPPAQLLEDIHRGLRGTRGAAVAIALLDEKNARIDYCGIGNISGVVVGDKMQYMISHSGIIGHTANKFQTFSYNWPPDAPVLMFSDGLQTRLSLAGYPGLTRRNTALIAGVLYRDFKRGRDDATAVVIRRSVT